MASLRLQLIAKPVSPQGRQVGLAPLAQPATLAAVVTAVRGYPVFIGGSAQIVGIDPAARRVHCQTAHRAGRNVPVQATLKRN